MSILRFDRTCFGYARGFALRDVELSIEPGELVALVGPNGSGKSTLLRLALGLHAATAGRIEIGGRDLGGHTRRSLAREAAFVPQGVSLDVDFTVEELVAMGREPYRSGLAPLSPEDRVAIHAALERTALGPLRQRTARSLSGGERQRILLARAFAQSAPLLLLDEPSSQLDLAHAYALLELVRDHVRAGGAALVAIHDLQLAARFADRMIVLKQGTVVANGAPRDVLTGTMLHDVFGVDAQVDWEPTFRLHVGRVVNSTNLNSPT
ncbi:MAG: ABC transporter ATP-binding protein [Polyangiales bacterium]